MKKKISNLPFKGTPEQEAQLKKVIDENKHIRSNGYVEIYSVNGILVSRIPAAVVSSSYERILNDLPQGVYIIKDGKIIRKIVRK